MEVQNEVGQNPGAHLKKKKKKKHERRGNKRAHAPKTDREKGKNVGNKKSRRNSSNENEPTKHRTEDRADEYAGNPMLTDQDKIAQAERSDYKGVAPDENQDTTMSTYDDKTMEEADNTQQSDAHDVWIALCKYLNCMQKKEYINEEDAHSELEVPPNQFFTNCNFFCSEHEEDYSTVNSVETNKGGGGVFCWGASHQCGESEDEGCGADGETDANHRSRNANMSSTDNIGSHKDRNDPMGGEFPDGGDHNTHTLHNADEENEQGEKQKTNIRIMSQGKEESHYRSENNLTTSSSLFSRQKSERNNLGDPSHGITPLVTCDPLTSREKIDRNVIFMQVRNFSQKIDEYISDEKIFRAQKLILHVKKYVEHYISYFKKINDEEAVQMLTEYYEENCTDKKFSYNMNNLKVHMMFYFFNSFHLHDLSSVLQDYSYYFSVDKNNSVYSDTMSNWLDNKNSHTVGENANMKRKSCRVPSAKHSADQSADHLGDHSDGGLPCGSSAMGLTLDGEVRSEQNGQVISAQHTDEGGDQSGEVTNEDQHADRHADRRADQRSDRGEETADANEGAAGDHPSDCNQAEEDEQANQESQIIVDKMYHHQCNDSSILSSNKVSIRKKNSEEETNINTKKSNRHMVKIIKKYSRRFRNFRKMKQNKEGWIKENDKYLDLWHRVDNNNNISMHMRAKLPYEVNKILSIISETELSTHWVPFLTSSQKIKSLSRCSAIIAQLYEYPIIGKKESLMYCLGANALEELGCVILYCMCPPEQKKDIEFYQNMCEQININKNEEILKVKEIPLKFRKVKREVTFFDCQLPEHVSKIERQRGANSCFLIYPVNNGNSTVLELFVHFENDFKYTPIKMVTYFIKKIMKNTYEKIVKACKNYDTIYAPRLTTNQEFHLWLHNQIKEYIKSKHQAKFIDSISLESYHGPENSDPL
ncbi:hypothetical protein C922_01548 [Plasmodium inui San Antonio 1]|uniref:START domain-containing protein n=1 Tax=Plasmodium inui San Antonio 1 TaxID=1237626 RepID=W7AR42_9APIC|nr:hypothetical protein C922_01548 [Plasmodium inui San Antonio 1]EUD67936.1 hypothetical protein C922_01548 [Plasmodium inui San Antonio 1]